MLASRAARAAAVRAVRAACVRPYSPALSVAAARLPQQQQQQVRLFAAAKEQEVSLEDRIARDIKLAEAERAAQDKAEEEERKRGVVRAPLRIFGLAGNYAHALFAACAADGTLEEADAQLRKFREIVRSDPIHDELFVNPALKQKDVIPLVYQILVQAAGGDPKKIVPSVQSMFAKLFENGRLGFWDEIITDFNRLFMATRNEIDATLTIAGPMYKSDIEKIKEYVQDYVMTDSADYVVGGKSAKVNLEVKMDPSIEGGFLVKFGDNIIDFSHKLAREAFQERVTAQVNGMFDSKMAKLHDQLKAM